MLKKNNLIGGYDISFFGISIDTNEKSINQMTSSEQTIFLHEYIHFLQDITTIYGLNNLYVYGEYISDTLNRIYKKPKGTIKVPFELDDTNLVLTNKQVREVTLGDFSTPCPLDKVTDVKVGTFDLLPNNKLNSIPDVTIEFLSNGNQEMMTFGAMAIMESMAYIAERLCSPKNYITSPGVPYMTAEKVADYLVPNFSANLEMIFALCDMSLQWSAPANFFVYFMNQVKEGNIMVNCPEDIYDYCYMVENGILEKNFDIALQNAINKLNEYLKSVNQNPQWDIYISGYKSWVNTITAFSKEFRHNNKYLLLNVIRGGEFLNNKSLTTIISYIGSCNIENKNSYYFQHPFINHKKDIMDVEFFRFIGAIINTFENGEIECPCQNLCKQSGLIIDSQCINSPWYVTQQRRCPYAIIWKHWNLDGYTCIK